MSVKLTKVSEKALISSSLLGIVLLMRVEATAFVWLKCVDHCFVDAVGLDYCRYLIASLDILLGVHQLIRCRYLFDHVDWVYLLSIVTAFIYVLEVAYQQSIVDCQLH